MSQKYWIPRSKMHLFPWKKLHKILKVHRMTFHKMAIPAFTARDNSGYVVHCTSCTVAGSDEFTEIKLVFRSCKKHTWIMYMVHFILMWQRKYKKCLATGQPKGTFLHLLANDNMKGEGKRDSSRSCRRTNTLFCKRIAKRRDIEQTWTTGHKTIEATEFVCIKMNISWCKQMGSHTWYNW